MMEFAGNELDFERATKLEWLETNGLGGYACGTVSGVRTRRYHGLLTASLHPPTLRTLLFAATEDKILCADKTYALTAHLFRDGTKTAWTVPTKFAIDWSPVWTYELTEAKIVKRVFMPHMQNAIVVRYFVQPKRKTNLLVRLFFGWRDHHWTMQPVVPFDVEISSRKIFVRSPFKPSTCLCHFAHNGDEFRPELNWWHNFWLTVETERGLDDTESLFCIGTIVKEFDCDGHLDIVASVEPTSVEEIADWEAKEIERRKRIVQKGQGDEFLSTLLLASDAFVAFRSSTGTKTVIAGYPWFTDWGRDSLISLSGLTLVTERFSVAREILLTFASYISEGMVPNFFPESGETPTYNTVDATLWFVIALYRYLRYTKDESVLNSLWSQLREILLCHLRGTRFGICADRDDGLLVWGATNRCLMPDAQLEALTWMDAKVWGKPVTQRIGKPVEVNALWCNALAILARLAQQVEDSEIATLAKLWADKAQRNFERVFWNESENCLFDVINPFGEPDPSVRCNQILALSLPFRLLSPEKEKAVLQKVERELLTSCGLRTLSPKHPKYIGRYIGPPSERDAAYHQGTVWAWWFGPYADAVEFVEGKKAVQSKVRHLLSKFLSNHLREACIGQVSEIFDGDEPHEPRGCFAQAWSVAEVLRAWVERVLGKIPKPLWDER
ncbi:MAG: amylo-alpha-1,6-glucosidase [Armatimonadetes bacterium]|nr:amylo-alpha-1,6-glucosidase [Armatimonadota bacterium]MDW8026841.1 amylo-alpha-1,6-glucosidase [Armatimonadota bacterium]